MIEKLSKKKKKKKRKEKKKEGKERKTRKVPRMNRGTSKGTLVNINNELKKEVRMKEVIEVGKLKYIHRR